MNLDMKIHPALVGLVIALTAIAIATKVWSDGKALSLSGPSQLLKDPHGRVYIQIQNQLLEHTSEGEFLRRYNLGDLGVDPLIGALAFFSDGDILLRRGEDRRTFLNTVAAYQRLENSSDLVPESPGAGLARCNLQSMHCVPFAEPPIDFKSTIGVFIDWRNDEVYVSDTSRHTLHKYSANGVQLAEPKRGFKFPNKILLHNDQLLVVDTNHHEVRVLDPSSERFARRIRSIGVVPSPARQAALRWPSHLARIGDQWWVNNMNNGMRDGGVFVYDDDWQYLRRISLPEDADPISILPFATGALISDWDNDRVYRVAKSGAVLDDFESPGLEAVLEESRAGRSYYRALSWMGIVALAAVLIGLVAKAIQSPKERIGRASVSEDVTVPALNDELIWFEPNPKTVRKIHRGNKLAGGLLLLLAASFVFITIAYGDSGFVLKIFPMAGILFLIYALIFWVSRANTGTAVGFHKDHIILRDHNGAESRCPIKNVVYNKLAIATPDKAVFLGQHPMPLYEPEVVAQQLLPRLANAKAISAAKMQGVLIQMKHPQGLVLLLVLIGFVFGGIYYLLN